MSAKDGRQGSWIKANVIKESHGRPIWCVCFNTEQPEHADLFATVGENTASVYRADPNGTITPLLTYVDSDPGEEFYVCKWSRDAESGHPLLLIAGKNAMVRVIDGTTQRLVHTFIGHGEAINDISVHYKRPHLPITASRVWMGLGGPITAVGLWDNSLRLWNIRTNVCILVLSGEGGHRNEVLSVDFHPSDVHKVVSAGMDYSIKIWSFAAQEPLIQQSERWPANTTVGHFPTVQLHRPLFSSYKLHFNFVDCVRWVGDCVLSKSPAATLLLWRPAAEPNQRGHAQVLQEYAFTEGNMWWLRFSTSCQLVACGNSGKDGSKVFVWDLTRPVVTEKPTWVIKRPGGAQQPVRQTAISLDGRVLLFACEDGTVWRYDWRGRDAR